MREYKSGTIWCVWRWTDVKSEYITRLHLVKTPWFALCIHWIHKPDPEEWLHDHPVSFLSIILSGGYVENRNGEVKSRFWWNYIKADENDRHSICATKPNTITFCFMGLKVREWGFHTDNGWIPWKTYYGNKSKS